MLQLLRNNGKIFVVWATLLSAAVLSGAGRAHAANTGLVDCSSARNENLTGTAWTSTGNACDSNGTTNASVSVTGTGASDYLVTGTFDFSSIPAGAFIDGIEVHITVTGDSQGQNDIIENRIRIVDENDTILADEKSTSALWPGTEGTLGYGGATDLWGTTWSRADVLSNPFAFAFSVAGDSSQGNQTITALFDQAQGRIYYTANSAPTEPTNILIEGSSSPVVGVTDLTPEFSAQFNDPNNHVTNILEEATSYQVEVNTQSDFGGTIMWNSGKQSTSGLFGAPFNEGDQVPNDPGCSGASCITYAGMPLSTDGSTYFVRFTFWDLADATGATSTVTAQFTMADTGGGGPCACSEFTIESAFFGGQLYIKSEGTFE